ncbi:disease resistance protein At4g27190-like isoform X2 [Amaranthus tricolor]|uniref:disease resistance protein At4g27190-like isoform X2 n=1 Tax=Amaranthus tricolor TaxID=29722 RepID=UPI002584FAC8|nr:disease resistance protein At4g27190-like isoform X2 [Amaranthus tricolor]
MRAIKKIPRLVKNADEDGFTWRLYGMKEISGAKYKRSYYRCFFRGCHATKIVQRSDDCNNFKVTYRGTHTCCFVAKNTPSSSEATESISYGAASNETSETYFNGSNSSYSIQNCIKESNLMPSTFTTIWDWDKDLLLNWEESEACYDIHNAGVSGEVRQEESILSSSALIQSNKPVLAESMFSRTEYIFATPHLKRKELSSFSPQCSSVNSSGSVDSNLQKLFSACQDVKVRKIGFYGTGGVGKTTAMKAFFLHYDSKRLFDFVLWVTIPRHFSRRMIQNALSKQLSLEIPNIKSDDEVAMILHQTLLAKKFILFLEDVWEYVDLLKIGIPIGNLQYNYMIILTATSVSICKAMEVDRIIKAEPLPGEESWKLFRFNVGEVLDNQCIEHYGRVIVGECYGLPLTIKVVGRALRMDSCIFSWKRALQDILLTDPLQVLKLGYDRLNADDMKSCFLYSALFIGCKTVRIPSLVEYLVDEGLFYGSMKRGHDVLKNLCNVSLLECSDGLMVEMHDLLCDLALKILSDVNGFQMLLNRYVKSILPLGTFLSTKRAESSSLDSHVSILRACEGFNESPSKKEWENAKMVFSMDNPLLILPERPACSKMLILFLQRNSRLRSIPSSFFDNMSSLQILNLSKTRIKSLPKSVSKLEHMQVLILRNCERLLFLPSEIGALKHLLVLDVHGTEICHLPDQVGELLCLVHLQVRFYGSMDQDECTMLPSQLISKGIIAKLVRLRELSIIVYPGDLRWTKIALELTREVSNLKLCSLSFHFPEINHLEYFMNVSPAWLHRTLDRFNFIVGHDVKRVVSHVSSELENEFNQQDRCLRFVDGQDAPDAIKKIFSQATAFYLDHHLSAYSLTHFGLYTMDNLKFCIVRDCPKLKTVINSKNLTGSVFRSLEILSIHYSWNLSRIWVGPIPPGSCLMLRQLSVHSCPKLEFILSASMVAVLPNLEELIVADCQSLKSVVTNEDQISADDDTIDSDHFEPYNADAKDPMEVDTFNVAELKIKVMKLHYLPKLVNIWSDGDLPCLVYVNIYNCPRLQNLNLKSPVEITLKEIKAETAWWDHLEWDDPALPAKLQGCVKDIQSDDIWGTV